MPQLLYGGKLDFLVFDYLSEITMSLLTAAKARSPVSKGDVRPQRCFPTSRALLQRPNRV